MFKKILTVLIMVSIVSIASANPINLVRDPGFEDPTWNNYNSWHTGPWGQSVGYWPGNGPSAPGSNCINLQGSQYPSGAPSNAGECYLYEPGIAITPGATYTFSFDGFTTALSAGNGYYAVFRYYDASNNQLGQFGPDNTNKSNDGVVYGINNDTWQTFSATGTVPLNAVSADVTFMYDNGDLNSHFFVDNVSLVQTPEPVTMALLGLGGLFLCRRKK